MTHLSIGFLAGLSVGLVPLVVLSIWILRVHMDLESRLYLEMVRRRRIVGPNGLDWEALSQVARNHHQGISIVSWDALPAYQRENWRRSTEAVVHAVLDSVTVCTKDGPV